MFFKSPVNIEKSSLLNSAQTCVQKAIEDFNAILSGQRPIHAIYIKSLGEGDTEYQGSGYLLHVTCRVGRLCGVDGCYYGPKITFTEGHPESGNTLSRIEFYTSESLWKLRDH